MQGVYARFLENGAYIIRHGTHPHRQTSQRDDRFVINLVLRNCHMTSVEAKNELQYVRNASTSERTVR